MRRTAAAIERLNSAFAGRDIVSVSHGGTIRAAVAHALRLTPEAAMAIVIDNLSLTRLSQVPRPPAFPRPRRLAGAGGQHPCRW